MIYNMSGYEKMDFMAFFDVRALKWLQNGPEEYRSVRASTRALIKHGEIGEDSKAAPQKVRYQYMAIR